MDFDPNSASNPDSGIFGLPHIEKDAALVYLPVPWEATTSYGGGTAKAPAAVLKASRQVDLFDFDVLKPYEAGLFLCPEDPKIRALNKKAVAAAKKIIAAGGAQGKKSLQSPLKQANDLGVKLNDYVHAEIKKIIKQNKIAAVLGGDHSTPYGAFKAAGEEFGAFGILHFDAHHDMRAAFEGFKWSHASIMHNALEGIPAINKMVQVGIRDFCEQERDYALSQGGRVAVFYDGDLARRKFSGEPWDKIAQDIIAPLPEKVWISFDIDGLDPRLCPHTGTPVPGGLDFPETNHIFKALVHSGRRIIGFDLVEVAPDPSGKSEWDANVGARLLYKLSAWTLASQGLAKRR